MGILVRSSDVFSLRWQQGLRTWDGAVNDLLEALKPMKLGTHNGIH